MNGQDALEAVAVELLRATGSPVILPRELDRLRTALQARPANGTTVFFPALA